MIACGQVFQFNITLETRVQQLNSQNYVIVNRMAISKDSISRIVQNESN